MKYKRVLENHFDDLKVRSRYGKLAILTMTTLARSGHPGGSMSSLDILISLYDFMNISSEDVHNPLRDRLVVSNGHISPAVYSVLAFNGFLSLENVITQYRLAKSPFEGHIEPSVPGVEWATGNLGQGLSAATAFALESKICHLQNQVYCLMGDGEQQKGQLSEARRFAKKYELNNLTAIVDNNGLQINGNISEVMPQNIAEEYIADGWAVLHADGHDYMQIFKALEEAHKIDSPVLILAKTVMGHGISFMENREKYHGTPLTENELFAAYEEIGDTLEYDVLKEKRVQIAKHAKDFFKTRKNEDEKPHIHFNFNTDPKKVYDKPTDNRSAWGDAIAEIARLNINYRTPIVVFDCDLQPSIKTADFEKVNPKHFIQAGIMEHHTAVCAGALSKTGIQTFFTDFGIFGMAETYNQHRLNDINHTNLKTVLTHVGLDVGEDGKTHQCIDYIGLTRNLFGYKLIIPADPNQTYRVINYVVHQTGNFLIPMGRSKLPIIKNEKGDVFFDENYAYEYGKHDILRQGTKATIFVCGTLTPTAVQVVDDLAQNGTDILLVNISSPLEISTDIIKMAVETGYIFTIEDHNVHTGLGSIIASEMINLNATCPLYKFGIHDYAFSGPSEEVYALCGLDACSIMQTISEKLSQV